MFVAMPHWQLHELHFTHDGGATTMMSPAHLPFGRSAHRQPYQIWKVQNFRMLKELQHTSDDQL